MDNASEPEKTILFEKVDANGVVYCTAEIFGDGSVYVSGLEIQMIFEFGDHPEAQAVAQLEELGYHPAEN
jgi:hypothetical protein